MTDKNTAWKKMSDK